MISILLLLLVPLSIAHPRIGICTVVFLLPFMPRYLGWGIGDEGFALTPRRVAMLCLILGIGIEQMRHSRIASDIQRMWRDNACIIYAILGLYVVKLIATIAHSGVNLNLAYVFDDFLVSLIPAIGLMFFMRSAADEQAVIMALAFSLLATEIFTIIEWTKGSALLKGFVEVSVKEVGEGGLTDQFRGNVYRAKALFDNPLSLSEFVCLLFPWAVYLWRAGATPFVKLLGLSATAGVPLTLYFAHSRSGWLAFVIGLLLFAALRIRSRSGAEARLVLSSVLTAALVIAAVIAYQVVMDPTRYFAVDAEGSRSVLERLSQYAVVANAWTESPLIGFGVSRNLSTDLEFLNNIDNFWLRLVVEGGAALLILFLFIISRMIVMAKTGLSSSYSFEYRLFMTAGLVCIAIFCVYKFFISITYNNVYFYIFVALILRREYWRKRYDLNAHTARPQ